MFPKVVQVVPMKDYTVYVYFEDGKIGIRRFNGSELYDQAQPGDTVIFTLQNGFFNIPVIKDKTKR